MDGSTNSNNEVRLELNTDCNKKKLQCSEANGQSRVSALKRKEFGIFMTKITVCNKDVCWREVS